MADLLSIDDLPDGFRYPRAFVRLVELDLTSLEPWWILEGDQLRRRSEGLRERYPNRTLTPFAARQDNDDVACWDGAAARVVVIHDFASPGWEEHAEFDNFAAWLRAAVEDFLDWE